MDRREYIDQVKMGLRFELDQSVEGYDKFSDALQDFIVDGLEEFRARIEDGDLEIENPLWDRIACDELEIELIALQALFPVMD